MRLFLAVAEEGSLSAAARRLRVAQPTVSRRLADLEASLGETLFGRGVEGTALTSFGERLLSPAKRMAEWAAELELAAERRETEPSGVVRITAPPGIAFEFVAPFAAELRRQLPQVHLEVISTVDYLDLSRRAADIAIRNAVPRQRDLVCVASVMSEAVPFSSPSYRERFDGKAQLADVDWIGWAPPLDHLTPNPQLARVIPDFRPVFASDDFLVQLRAAEQGIGAIFLARVGHRFLREARLVELPVDIPPVPTQTHVVCSRSALAVPRIRAVAELLKAEFVQIEEGVARRSL